MRCELIRELIFADYTDGELSGQFRQQVDEHIRSCASCAELVKRVREEAVAPVRNAPKEEPPPYLWARVKERIAAEVEQRAEAGGLVARLLRGLSRIPKPAVAFAAAAAVIVAVLIARPVLNARSADAYISEQVEFMTRLGSPEANGNGYFDIDIGKSVDDMV